MQTNDIKPLGGIVAAVFASLFGVPEAVNAQNQQTLPRTIEEVIVTAQKRSESLQDVPIAIKAFSGDDLFTLGTNDISALSQHTPGLVYENTGSVGSPYLRGIGSRFSFAGLESSVATYVDNRYVANVTAGFYIGYLDVERVEVLKGPQGTLFGRNASGGAIRIITKDVSDEFEGKLSAGVGNYDSYHLTGTVNIPISEKLAGRFSAMTRQRDGFADNIASNGQSQFDDQDLQAYRAKLRWDVTDSVTARLSLDYWETDDSRGADFFDITPNGLSLSQAAGGMPGRVPDKVSSNINRSAPQDEFSSQLQINASFNSFDFVSITTYTDFDSLTNADADGTNIRGFDNYTYQEEESYSQELQLLSNTDGNWEWLAGLYFYDSDAFAESAVDSRDIFRVFFTPGNQFADITASAVFGQSTWHFRDRWSLTLGGRWSYEEKEVVNKAPIHADVSFGAFPYQDDDDWNEFTPKVTLEYQSDYGMLFATYARGFKSGGWSIPATSNRTNLEPEILDMIEVGFKGDLLEKRLRLNASVYYYDVSDLQVTRAARAQQVSVITENAADSTLYGLDLDLTWLATDRLTLGAALNAMDSEYENYEGATAPVLNAIVTGNPTAVGGGNVLFDADGHSLLRAPDLSATLSLDYEFQVGAASLPVNLSYSYTDEYNFDFVAHPTSSFLKNDSYGIWNARASYISPEENWRVSLWGSNLTDEEYLTNAIVFINGFRVSFGEPRTFGVDISYNF